jgi:site-specific DNA recombinase
MTLAMGKGGKYRYYKCSSPILRGKDTCMTENLPTEEVDGFVLSSLADWVFTATRVTSILGGIRRRLSRSKDSHDGKVRQVTKELEDLQKRSGQLYCRWMQA